MKIPFHQSLRTKSIIRCVINYNFYAVDIAGGKCFFSLLQFNIFGSLWEVHPNGMRPCSVLSGRRYVDLGSLLYTTRWRCCSTYLHRHTVILSYIGWIVNHLRINTVSSLIYTSTFVLINRYVNLSDSLCSWLSTGLIFWWSISWAKWKGREHI